MHHLPIKRWWRDRFVTLMLIPERTRQVHKLVLPFFLLKLSAILLSLGAVFLIIMLIDYIHVLGRMAENKRLKGENFKLRQELQIIRNKVDSMESTVERVRNYAKKLQILTGEGAKGGEAPILEGGDIDSERAPATKGKRSSLTLPIDPETTVLVGSDRLPLLDRMSRLRTVSLSTETSLTKLQIFLVGRSAIIAATPTLLPINGVLSSTFGYRRHPYDGAFRLHAGVDIAAEPGTPVRAPADGAVIFSGSKDGYGKVIVIDHGYGIRTLFAHNSKLFVNQGVRVKRGETISQVGSTGMSTGPHLHYEVRKNGVPVNPAAFFSRARF